MERLQKAISNCGIASRRAAEQMIVDGKVRVNGVTVRELGTKVDLEKDVIIVDGKRIEPEQKRYFLFNKPKGVITTSNDEQGRETVMDYFKKVPERIYAVGRLDQNTEGLLIMAAIAVKTGVPVVPAAIIGSRDLPKKNGPVCVVFGPALTPAAGKKGKEEISSFNEQVRQAIMDLKEQYGNGRSEGETR